MKMSFNQSCYVLLKLVPQGQVTTYREIAHKLETKAYQAVGNAMNKNPYAPAVPCHRVVKSNGELGGFAFGSEAKIKILKEEGVEVRDGKIVDFEEKLFRF